jgi:hypothetical protein
MTPMMRMTPLTVEAAYLEMQASRAYAEREAVLAPEKPEAPPETGCPHPDVFDVAEEEGFRWGHPRIVACCTQCGEVMAVIDAGVPEELDPEEQRTDPCPQCGEYFWHEYTNPKTGKVRHECSACGKKSRS